MRCHKHDFEMQMQRDINGKKKKNKAILNKTIYQTFKKIL